MKKKWLVFGAVVVISLVSIGALAGAAESGTPFSDVPAGYWATSAIQSAVSKGYVSGYPDGTFKPDREVSRAEFVKMLADALDLPRSRGGSPWYQPYAAALLDEGVLVESDFSDYQAPISRLEIMRLVSRGLARDERYREYLEAFSGLYNGDLPYVDYRELEEADVPYAALAIGSGILGGYPDVTMGLSKRATRAEAVVMIERLRGLKSKAPEAFQALRELKEVAETGTNATTVSSLIPEINLKEEDAIMVTPNYSLKIKRYYVMPLEGDVVSIYERKFLWDRYDMPPHFLQNKRGYVAVVTELTPNKDGNQELFRQNTYANPGSPFYYGTPSLKFDFIHPYPSKPVSLKKDTASEVVFYGLYSNEYFNVGLQSNTAISGGWYRLLHNPDKLKASEAS
jgi:hypothetical protein